MAEDYVQIPADSTGKKIRAASTVKSANTVYQHYMIPVTGSGIEIFKTRELVSDATTTVSNSVSETTILSAVSSTYLDLTALMISNTSASSVRADFRDNTGGTIRFSMYLPSGDTRGIVFQIPKPQTYQNKNWTIQAAASVVDLRVYVQAVKNS